MRVQHPEKRQFSIVLPGQEPIETDDKGIAEVDDDLGKSLLKQDWTRTDKGGNASDKEK